MAPAFRVPCFELAAEIRGVELVGDLAPSTIEWLLAAWRWHAVLVFRDQALTADTRLVFSHLLSVLDRALARGGKRTDLTRYPEIVLASNIVVRSLPIGELSDGEPVWHNELTHTPAPPVACFLHAHALTPLCGDTLFLDLRAAWRRLPRALQDRASAVGIFHDGAYAGARTRRLDAQAGDGTWHPIRIADPLSGEPALLLGRQSNHHTDSGEGPADDPGLLEALWRHADDDNTVYRHVWRPGDAVLWNNLTVMYRRDPFRRAPNADPPSSSRTDHSAT